MGCSNSLPVEANAVTQNGISRPLQPMRASASSRQDEISNANSKTSASNKVKEEKKENKPDLNLNESKTKGEGEKEEEGSGKNLNEEKAPIIPVSNTTRNKMSQEEEVVDIDLNDPEVANAALKIQSGFRGHQVRKQMKDDTKDEKKKDDETELSKEMAEKCKTNDEEEELPDLNDPEIQEAASKIQAGFRGHMVRKDIKKKADAEGDEKENQ